MAKSFNSIKAVWKNPESKNIGKKKSFKDIKSADYNFGIDESRINSFLKSSKEYFDNVEKETSSVNYNNAQSKYASNRDTIQGLSDEAKTIRAYYNANKDKMDSATHKNMMEYLNAIEKSSSNVLNYYQNTADSYSKFKTEAEYNDAVKLSELYDMPSADILPYLDTSGTQKERDALVSRQKELEKQIKELGASGNKGVGANKKTALAKELNDVKQQIINLDNKNQIAYTTSGGQNITWSSLYDKKKAEEDFNALYNELSANPDWAEQSQYITTNKKGTARANSLIDLDTDWEYEDINKYQMYITSGGASRDLGYAQSTTDKEKAIFNYLYHTQGKETAMNWHKSREDIYKSRIEEEGIQRAVKFAEDYPVLSDIAGVLASVVSGGEFLADALRGDIGDTNQTAAISSAIKGTRMEQIDWEVGDWDAFDFLYGTGTSMAESVISNSMFGYGGGFALGLSAAAQGTNDALNRGMSKGQAFASGVASGIFEGIFESWSFGAFTDLTKNLKRADLRSLAKYVGKNMWNNAKEETLTEIANIVYDTVVNGDFSQYETAIRQYVNSGMSESDAKKKVAAELGLQVVEAGGSGALMGFGFGAGGSVGVAYNTLQRGKAIQDAGQTRNLVDLGKSLGEGTESYNFANTITDKSKAYAIGQLLGIAAEDIESANKGDIVKALEEKGYDTKKANNIADLMLDPDNKMFANSRGISAPGQIYNDIINNPNSTVSQRNEAYKSILRGVAENRNNKANGKKAKTDTKPEKKTQGILPLSPNYVENRIEQLVASGIPIEQATQVAQNEFANNQGKMSTQTEKAVESKFESNTEGKDINTANGKIITSKKLVASNKDNMAFEVTYDDDTTENVDAKDISFGNEGEALVYSAVMDMNVPVGVAETLIKGYKGNDVKSAGTYVNGVREAFVFGKYNQEADLNNGAYASQLTEEQRNNAFKLGKIYANEKAIEDTKAIVGEAKPNAMKKREGKLHFEGDKLSLTSVQDVSIKNLKVLTMAIGKDIHIFESYVDENGKRVYKDANGEIQSAPNGFYQQLDGSIWIDLNAGNSGQGIMMYTVAHELTHFIKQWSPTKFKALADFLVEQYGKEGVSVADLVREQQRKAAKHNRKISYDVAFEEMVADSMEAMLTDGKVIRELANKDKTLFDKIKSWIDNLLRRLDKEYKNYTPESTEGQTLLEMKKTFGKVQKLFADALTDASENFAIRGSDKAFVENYLKTKDVVYNLRAAESHQDKLAENYTSDASIDLETLQKRYAKVIGIWEKLGGELNSKFLNEWNNKVGKDRAFTIFKAQAGYKYNVELSSMCKKGVPLFEAIDTIVKKEIMNELKTKTLGKAEKEILYDILKNHNFEIPCAICYVEQARQREGVIINDFLDGKIEKNAKGKITKYKLGWNDVLNKVEKEMKKNGVDYTFRNVDKSIATDSYSPADIVMDEATQDAFYKALKKVANAEIVRWNREDRKSNQKERKQITDLKPQTIKEVFKGTLPSNLKIFKVLFNNPSSRFKISRDLLYSSATTLNLANAHNDLYSLFNSQGGVAGYKTKQAPIVYWGDILGKSWKPSTVRKEGGIRNQSNSDFQMYTLLDQAQMYIDFSAKGYYLQAYTKVLAELKLFGLSRGKINASLIPQVIEYKNADGSINWEKTMENAGLDENGNPIYDDFEGINHAEAFMLIEDAEYSKNICGICIGYSDNHIRKLLDDNRIQQIIGFHDKTDNPEKRYRGAKYSKNYNGLNEAVKVKADGTEETVHVGFNQFVSKAEKMFKFNKKTETFEGTVNHNGKEYSANDIPKLAADLYLEMCAEKNYRPAYNDFSSHKNYYKLLADFGLYDSQGNYAPHQKVQYNMPDKVPYLDKNGNKAYMSTEAYIKAELQKELTVRDSISEALADTSENGIIPQFVERVNALHTEKADTTLLSDRDSAYMEAVNNGDMETAQRLVDEAARENGYPVKAYHGTNQFGFTKFDASKSDDKTTLFFTENIDVAKTYAGRDIHGVKNIKDAKSFKYEKGKVYTEAELLEAHDVIQSKYHVYGLTKVNVEKQTLTHAGTRYSAKQIFEMADSIVKEGIYGVYLNTDNFLEVDAEHHGWSGIRNPLVDEWKYKINYQGDGDFNYFKAKADDIFHLELLKNGESVHSGTIQFSEMHKLLRNAIGSNRVEMAIRHATNGSGEGSSTFAIAFSDQNGEYESPYMNTRELAKQSKKQGYNGVKIKNLYDWGGRNTPVTARFVTDKKGESTIYILFDSNQVKSADPITYDDNGNVIPLSQRFNKENEDIRYSLRDVNPIMPTSSKWQRTQTTAEVKAQFPDLWDVSADESDVRNPTQISGTVKSYRKVYDFLKNTGFNGTILDASSGLGYGTRAGIEEYGFDVEDIEPYPDASYSPKYTDYSALNKKYDVIISNAVLNVLPQDQRDALVVKMGEMLKDGGRMFVNVRGDDVKNASSKVAINEDLMEYYISKSGSYQKGFTKTELVAYLEDALGEGYTVTPTSFFGKTSAVVTKKESNIRYSERDYAPTFYSQMGKVVEGVKQEKLAANSVVNMLRGKGVKAEEIRWSGIVPFLEGKKSVTKQELLNFINGSMLQIGEEMSGARYMNAAEKRIYSEESFREKAYLIADEKGIDRNKVEFMLDGGDIYAYVGTLSHGELLYAEGIGGARWSEYKLDGGKNYRELVFTLPNNSYSNNMMRVHWGEDAEGVLVHARIQDFDVNGKKMLFIEEIQSDYHNEGFQSGYMNSETDAKIEELKAIADEKFFALEDYSTEMTGNAGEWDIIGKTSKGAKLLREYRVAKANYENAMNDYVKKIPDAPFKENYHEFVLKRLLRMAAEQGYDSIGWTPSEIQSDRWSDEFAEAYRIEYDQEMPKFLRKYGRQWGAKVENTSMPKQTVDGRERILKEIDLANAKRDIESAKKELARHHDSYERARIQMSIDSMEKTVASLEKELSASLNIWSMDITDSMKNSVLYDGQTLYSERDTDSVSTRSLLANALEGAAQNEIEKNKLAQYKEKIALIEAEQNKLHELREKLFTKGINGDERRKIQEEATRTANRINTYDRQLFNLESTTALKNVLNREKDMARKRQKQKDAENLRAYKEKVADTTRQLLEKNRESRAKAVEGRNKTEMRHKVKKVVGDLNNLLLNPTKERHIPEEMRIAVAEALALVNMDTVDADTRVARYNELIAKEKNPDVIASLTESRDRILNQGTKLGEKLAKLKDAYDKIRKSTDDSVNSMYDDVIYNKIESVQEKVGKTPLRNMTLEQLENVYELYKMVLTFVRDSNKAFAEDLKMTRQALGSNTFAEIKANNKARERIKFEGIERFGWKNLKPMQAMKTIGSGILQKLWNNVLYGQEVFAQDYDEAVKFAKEMKEKYGYSKWDLNKLYSFESKSGKVMKINLEQMMSIYAYSKRKQADKHIEEGGILLNESIIKEKKFGRTVEIKVNDSTAYRLDKTQVGLIIATLEKQFPGAKDFVDEMQKYLSETMGEKGNEVAMKMYGIKLFKEEHYFPLKSSKDFMESANAKLKGDVKIKNKGMTKETNEHANNPIVLEGFLDVWGNHVNEMAMYHGLVLPLEDFSRTLNYGFKADDDLNADAESVRTALREAFGESADNYLNELLKAINGGVLYDSSTEFADKMISKFKKAKVMASLSVVVQQPTAIIRAMGIIEPKYFTSQNFHHKQTWEELKKYCPTAIIKETGSFDTNMGRTIVDMVKEDRKFTEKVGDALGKAPAWMDEMGWNMIWRALKKKVATEQHLSGETLLKECGKQMTIILNETQVYDSVMSRNELMRSKSALTKMATSFMGEPSTVANMIYGAVLDFKRGKKGIASKTVAAVISSVIVNGLVSSLVYAFRDDDEDETWLEKYLESATTEVADGLNPLTYIPYVKDIYSMAQGYDVERTDLALAGDVMDALEDFYKVLDPEEYEDMSSEEIAKHIYENSIPLLTAICDMFGLPVGNILRDAEAIIVNDNLSMSKTSSEGIGLAIKEGWINSAPKVADKFFGDEKYHKLYLIANNGDTAYVKNEVAEMVAEKVESGKTEKEAKQSVKSSLTSVYREEYKKAYKNRDSQEMNRIRKFLYATGLWNSLSELDSLLAKWRSED